MPREEKQPPPPQEVAGYTFVRSDLECDKLRIDQDDRLGFTMKVTVHKEKPPEKDLLIIPFVVTLAPFDIKIPSPELLSFVPLEASALEACAVGVIHPVKIDVLSLPLLSPEDPSHPLIDSLRRRLFDQVYSPTFPTVMLNNCFENELAKFLKELNGFTSNASDNLLRMLYLSAVTITTIGYGDIVPISPHARALVTGEAIVGAILIGLFLNSLSPERGRSETKASK